MGQLSAPFPYYGGKARIALAVWRELGDVTVYAEPFAGSLAVLLASEPHRREIVCDTDGHIVNFWRALRNDPAGVAFHADYPTFHQDLRARHLWLRRWGKERVDSPGRAPSSLVPTAAPLIQHKENAHDHHDRTHSAAQAPQARRRAQHPAGEGRPRTQGAARLRILPADHTDR